MTFPVVNDFSCTTFVRTVGLVAVGVPLTVPGRVSCVFYGGTPASVTFNVAENAGSHTAVTVVGIPAMVSVIA